MSQLRMTLEVARWEFRRYFKIRQQVISVVLMVVAGLASFAGVTALRQTSPGRIAVIGGDRLPFVLPADAGVEVVAREGDLAALRRDVGEKKIDGLLVVESADRAELVVQGRPAWLSELQTALDSARRDRALRSLGVTPEALGAALAPVDVAVTIHEGAGRRASRAERLFVVALLVLMLLGVFLGNAYLFVGITGEKQLRVTEQVVAAISPQTWIDGKILGISALAIALVAVYGAGVLATLGAMNLLGAGIPIPFAAVDPVRVALYLVLALLGFIFWFAFFAAIAATVNDPNTSARGSFLFLPLLPLGFAFAALSKPDAPLLVALGIFPASSPAVLPARLVLGDVAAWEVAAAIALLVLAIWALRRIAGKVFALGILMFGKEPTWSEMWYWIRRA